MGTCRNYLHVDSYKGPAVFFDLDQLQTGDEVLIYGQGSILTFEVKEVVAYPTKKAPINQIFGSSDSPSLNLITCTGLYNREAETHQERLVVYTELVAQKDA
ncbi:class F sortase [Halobacillus sp. B23F22_1]|uniref:class F sortase n=1 Tax=Halobacillus sp. B23F22_1 TaxID=3459514 RepID=UPI00373E281C